ncbi:MAG: Stp1/IreP family PP2C-type Ser/Thr phosphatase [Nitrospirae bacterium]|nr:MAG: Stp1/IreP family PP2C-type Ser/Thr phosphatase [Nitrospirota bacterium]
MSRLPGARWYGAGRTDVGLVRQANQDALFLRDELGLWIIADGMGGHPGGDVASQVAVATTATHMAKLAGAGRPGSCDRADGLRQAVIQANVALHAEGNARPEYKGMGTTLIALHIEGFPQARATLAHVGDSRAYLHRDGALSQLTRDHSWVEDQVRAGLLSAQDAATHHLRHMLTRALGIAAQVEPDLLSLRLQTGDRILLCTDGLTKMLSDGEILNALAGYGEDTQAVCDELVRLANERGGQDNVTVLLVSDQIGMA